MKRILLFIFWQFCLLPGANAFVDVVTLKNGARISGFIESGDKGKIQIKVGDNHPEMALDQIQSIQFGPPADAPLSVASHSLTLPLGTEIAVRTIDPIDSKKADLSHEYAASLDDPIVIDGAVVAPANANAVLRVAEIHNSRLKRASLSIVLIAVTINGQRVEVKTDAVDSQSGSRAKRTLTGTAVGAGVGAAVGAAAGGAVGAGIGAGAGAVAGTVGGVLSGKGVEIAPEIRFTYKLSEAVAIHTLVLRKGMSVTGAWAGVDAWQISFRVNGQDQTYPRPGVLQVTFSQAPPETRVVPAVETPPTPAVQKYVELKPPPPPTPDPAPPVKLEKGQTIGQVIAQLGQPNYIADLGNKQIYLFKEWKITFVDGKLSDIDVR